MSSHHRFHVTAIAAAIALVAFSSLAAAQAYECKPTETQAECHTRLKCKADEELEACKKRLKNARSGGDNRRDDRSDRDGRGDDRGDRGRDDRGRDDRGRDDRDDRGDRGDRRRHDDDRGDRDDGRSRGRDRGRRRGRGRRSGGGRGFEANKTFGMGLELGAPSGINGKYFVKPSGALDFGLGVIYRHYYYDDGLHAYLDYLWHPVSLASTPSLELPLYIGIGARLWNFDYCDRNNICDFGTAFGIRIPVGISFDFNNAPIDLFLQLVPVIDFVSGDYYNRFRDRNHVGIDGSVGLRFWFK